MSKLYLHNVKLYNMAKELIEFGLENDLNNEHVQQELYSLVDQDLLAMYETLADKERMKRGFDEVEYDRHISATVDLLIIVNTAMASRYLNDDKRRNTLAAWKKLMPDKLKEIKEQYFKY